VRASTNVVVIEDFASHWSAQTRALATGLPSGSTTFPESVPFGRGSAARLEVATTNMIIYIAYKAVF
jgi:hypothetical protein